MQNKLCMQALAAETDGRLRSAIADYRRAIACDAQNPTPYLYLGYALEKQGDHEAATQVYSLAADLDGRVVDAWRSTGSSAEVAERSQSADRAIRRHFTDLHRQSVWKFHQRKPAMKLDRIYAAIWCATHDRPFEYRAPRHQPQLFYVPDLAPTSVFDDEQLPWKSVLEDAFEAIRDEFLAIGSRAAAHEGPYLGVVPAELGDEWQPISASSNWSSLFLYRNATANPEVLDLVPRTWEAMQQVPTVKVGGNPTEILFSILKGKQRIPPHYGLANTATTVHLPLVISEEAALRVTDTVHEWHEGEVFAFDDSFEHESWNHGESTRVNVLFEVWHPDLTEDECGAIAAAFEARTAWNRSRKI